MTTKKRIKTITRGTLQDTLASGGCGACQNSCQSACKTSLTVSNQPCAREGQ
ncbi:MAG: six-cysteine ranthipeptide SCIFF [bacterium]|jgi:predicted ribosomally synthesized six-cysteine peptide SCIFF|nr:six-cysteine ranthipeptide SCIFF [Bacillota bacterium]HHW55831.1 six-cysteine peptide SCIFF [Bacillota bacterium]